MFTRYSIIYISFKLLLYKLRNTFLLMEKLYAHTPFNFIFYKLYLSLVDHLFTHFVVRLKKI